LVVLEVKPPMTVTDPAGVKLLRGSSAAHNWRGGFDLIDHGMLIVAFIGMQLARVGAAA